MAGAPLGNKNSSKENRLWTETIRRAALRDKAKKLNAAAEALLDRAMEGDVTALKEFGDRMDGKPAQTIQGAGENGEHKIDARIEMVIVDAS